MSRSVSAPEHAAPRGLVVCAGGKRYFTCAWVLVSLLRHHGFGLPIELWHRGPGELDQGMADLIATKGVTVRDAAALMNPEDLATPEALRLAAITASDFDQIISIDADCAPLGDLTALFSWQDYLTSGLLLFPDDNEIQADDAVWQAIGLAPRCNPGVDSGIVVIDRTRRSDVLAAARTLVPRIAAVTPPGRRPVSSLLMAALAGIGPFSSAPYPPFQVEHDLVHRGEDGEAFVQHRRTSKWHLGGQDRETPSPEATDIARRSLDELGRLWSGAIFTPPTRSDAAKGIEDELAARRHFVYQSADGGWRRLDLHRGGRIGEGRNDFEQHWAVVERAGRPVLQFYSDIRLAIEFERLADGTWRGASCGPPGFAARLAAADCRGLLVTVP